MSTSVPASSEPSFGTLAVVGCTGDGEDRDLPKGHAVSVLIVEDDPDQQALCKAILEREGHRVTVTSSATDAYTALTQTPVDVVVCDVRMPLVSGLELVRKIRRARLTPANPGSTGLVPIIMLSAVGAHLSRSAIESGADLFCEKREAITKLPSQIRSLLARSKRQLS